jgi:hypothetical protein
MVTELYVFINYLSQTLDKKACKENKVIRGFLLAWHGASSGCGWRSDLQYGG